MLLLGVSHGCGFKGGLFFPIFNIGITAGIICSRYYPAMPFGLCIGAFFVAIPAAIAPMPLTLLHLVCYLFYFGDDMSVVVMTALITSYGLGNLCVGFFSSVKNRLNRKEVASGSGIGGKDQVQIKISPASDGEWRGNKKLKRSEGEGEGETIVMVVVV